uniref:Translin-associated factor X-interacting protein 1-like n=1 Tax=Saccoglossus kowalevskii TaxID=10224 RepID=A0ABM0GX56_SACKO|nr:PREDICTED: translin-associated factor X-interacting protein 1-like [Saccoglossus kowalevskii]
MSSNAVAKLPPIASPPNKQGMGISPRIFQKYQGLTGPQFQISSEQHRYNLPEPHVLKPYVDTVSGAMDTWPAHASNQSAGSAVNSMMNPSRRPRSQEAQQSMIPKPQFLQQLDAFLKKELRALESSEVGPSEMRLQAYREVFEYLIEDFKTYKPLLSAIKNEYEMMLSYQREQIRELEPLRSMLVTVSEQCDQKIMDLRNQEKEEMADLKKENRRLIEKIDTMKEEQMSLTEQIQQLQDEVATEYHKYRDECDARKLLVADINDLRYQQEDFQKSQMGMQEAAEDESKDDPVLLKIALKLNEMIANYGGCNTKKRLEALEKSYNNFQEEMQTMQDDHKKLMMEHDTLLEVHKQVLAQRDQFYQELEQLKRSATPRPYWEKCVNHIEGGEDRWKKLSEGKTSDELVDVLLSEIVGGDLDGSGDDFEGQGLGEEIPKYLRHEGKVKNRKLGKRDTVLLIKDIWREKVTYDAEKNENKRSRMCDFLYDYILRRFAIGDVVVEWGYNLQDAAKRFQEDDRIGLFYGILNEEIDEEVYHDQMQTLAKLMQVLTKADADAGNTGALPKEKFESILKGFFPLKSEERMNVLINSAISELKLEEDSNMINYQDLFTEDDEGRNGPFIRNIREQEQEERNEYIEDIIKELGRTEGEVTMPQVRMAINIIDPMVEKTPLIYYLSRGFNTEKDQLDSAQPTDIEIVMNRFRTGAIKRAGAPDIMGVN